MPGLKILVIVHRFNSGSTFCYDKDSTERNYNYYIPTGLAYIVSALKQAGFDVDALNLNHIQGKVHDIIKEKIPSDKYDMVFLGGVSIYYPNLHDLIAYIREASPSTKIVAGGGIITAQPSLMFKLLKPDYIIIGEGEQSAVELARTIQSGENLYPINGVGYPGEGGKLIITPERQPIRNLDILPFPDYEALGLDEFIENTKSGYVYDKFDYPRVYPILTSRSCAFNCTFCFHTTGKKYRQRSIDNIMQEVEFAIRRYKINMFFFYDELFSHDTGRVVEFCERFKEIAESVTWEVRFTVELRVDNINERVLDSLKGAGCVEICLGLESYNQTVLNSMRKHITQVQIRTALEMISGKDMAATGNFIFGDPSETLDTAKETLDFVAGRQDILHGIRMTFIIPFQGSEVYKKMVNEKRILNEAAFIEDRATNGYDYHNPMNMTGLSSSDFEKLKDMVFTTHYTKGTYASPTRIENNIDSRCPVIYVRCPLCGNMNVYRNMNAPGPIDMINLGCRGCNGRFELTGKYHSLMRYAIKTFGFANMNKIRKLLS